MSHEPECPTPNCNNWREDWGYDSEPRCHCDDREHRCICPELVGAYVRGTNVGYKSGKENAALMMKKLMLDNPFVFPTDTATVEATIATLRGGEQE